MKKKECPSCAMEVDAGSTVCPICGYEFPSNDRGSRMLAVALLLILLLSGALGFYLWLR